MICPPLSWEIPIPFKLATGLWRSGIHSVPARSVTAGIISAKDRGNVARQFQRFLQTDAAINPGIPAGPLVNMSGQVVGITRRSLRAATGMKVCFALPSNTAIGVYNQLIATAK